MKLPLRFGIALAVALATAQAAAQANDIRIDATSPAATVARHFGWLEAEVGARGVTVQWVQQWDQYGAGGGQLDFTGADGAAALKARAAGGAVKAVYVLWRGSAGDDQYLLVSEAFLAQRPEEAQAVIAAFERARKWIAGNPEHAARILSPGATARNLSGSRPGPAQLVALKFVAQGLGLEANLAAQLLDDSLVRATIVGAARLPGEGGFGR